MKREEFSILNRYGDREIFGKKYKQGYTEVAHGSGEWRGSIDMMSRVVNVWAFFHPKKAKAVSIRQQVESQQGFKTSMNRPSNNNFTEAEFAEYCEERQITLEAKQNLDKLLEEWDKGPEDSD